MADLRQIAARRAGISPEVVTNEVIVIGLLGAVQEHLEVMARSRSTREVLDVCTGLLSGIAIGRFDWLGHHQRKTPLFAVCEEMCNYLAAAELRGVDGKDLISLAELDPAVLPIVVDRAA